MNKVISDSIKIQSKDGRIIGLYLPNGKVKIYSGSFFRNVEVNSIRQNIRNKRQYLINNGYIKNHQLVKEYIFDNPSIAISTLMGHMETGNQAFITLDNIELGDYIEVNGKDSSNKETKVNNLLIKLKENNLSNSETESLLDEDDLVIVISTNDIVELDIDEAEFIPAIKPEKVIGSRTSYKRNVDKAKKCILLANYKCEIDNNHKSFVSKNGNPYMEAHHLIPLSTQEYFEYSLDVDANIICLCPNCHKKLHHGGNIETDLRRIYDDRINNLKKSGIDIDFKVLLELYR